MNKEKFTRAEFEPATKMFEEYNYKVEAAASSHQATEA